MYNKKDAGTNTSLLKANRYKTYIYSTADALAEICKEQEESIHSTLHLGRMFQVSAPIITNFIFSLLRYKDTTQENKNYTTKQDRAIWRLLHKTDETSTDEEVVVSFQGIICKKDMAPYNEKNTCV